MTRARPLLARTGAELDDALSDARRQGRAIGLVPTMGALHVGHAELLRAAREQVDTVVVSVFVNPLQFGPGEDFERYPRGLPADLDVCAEGEVDLVWAPAAAELYPDGAPLVRVCAGGAGEVLEGASRPGHFDGVLTVVAKLLHRVRPGVAFFGEKDFQQITLVRRMVRDLDMATEIAGVPTARAPDGLALSSRNRYLDGDERAVAATLFRALRVGAEAAGGVAAVLDASRVVLAAQPGLELDYLVVVDSTTLDEVPAEHTGPARLLAAGWVGTTRLIDNVAVDVAASTGSD